MRRILTIALSCIVCMTAKAQINDTTAVVLPVKMDTTLLGRSIYDVMPSHENGDAGNVVIEQSLAVTNALNRRIESNSIKEMNGYRVRIYFSNAQNARAEANSVAEKFTEKFGTHSVYITFVSPNFKVTVGDFRTKSEALELLSHVKRDFPSAFVVKESILPKD